MKVKFPFLFFLLFFATQTAFAAIQTEEIEYSAAKTQLKGFLAFDDSLEGQRPGILIVHEWWGHTDYVRDRARQLAEAGYTAFALDMYGSGQTAEHPTEAGAFSKQVSSNTDLMQQRFQAALDVLKSHWTVRPDQVAAIGYCFGGGVVLNMARLGADLAGVVSFHGSLKGPLEAEPGSVKAKVLVFHGGRDPMVSKEDVQAFKDEMNRAQADFEVVIFENATHSFTNPKADEFAEKFDLPVAYNEEADQASWQLMLKFFSRLFKGRLDS